MKHLAKTGAGCYYRRHGSSYTLTKDLGDQLFQGPHFVEAEKHRIISYFNQPFFPYLHFQSQFQSPDQLKCNAMHITQVPATRHRQCSKQKLGFGWLATHSGGKSTVGSTAKKLGKENFTSSISDRYYLMFVLPRFCPCVRCKTQASFFQNPGFQVKGNQDKNEVTAIGTKYSDRADT